MAFGLLPRLHRFALLSGLAAGIAAGQTLLAGELLIVKDGTPVMAIVVGNAAQPAPASKAAPAPAPAQPSPAQELQTYIARISGAMLAITSEAAGSTAGRIYVGKAADFNRDDFAAAVVDLGAEGCLVRSVGNDLLLLGKTDLGAQHAVQTFLRQLGCRWFFPGATWEVIPAQPTIAGSWNETQTPSYDVQRRIWYGYGAYGKNAADLRGWNRHNRMGGAQPIVTSHSWIGLNNKRDFAEHPEWFALYKGRRRPTKPCYSHPAVIQRAIDYALDKAAAGASSISVSAPDGLQYCECERCRAVAQGGRVYYEQHAQYARRPDGQLVNITSETLFAMANQVAAAVTAVYPDVWIGCLAYSSYAHPPSFRLHPRLFVEVTTSYRCTPLSCEQQLDSLYRCGLRLGGIYAYFSVFPWDWDYPVVQTGDLALPRLVQELRFFHRKNFRALNAETSNSWGPRGLGLYLAAQLLWDVDQDAKALIADFYTHAFGPAAGPIQNYYARWLGDYVRVLETPGAPGRTEPGLPQWADESRGQWHGVPAEFNRENLRAAYRDLDEAAALVRQLPGYRERVDHLRMYMHYMYLRHKLEVAAKRNWLFRRDKHAIVQAIAAETVFAARLTDTNLVHSRAAVALAFERRFKKYRKYLADQPEGQGRAGVGKGFRVIRHDVPDNAELEQLWAQDKAELGLLSPSRGFAPNPN